MISNAFIAGDSVEQLIVRRAIFACGIALMFTLGGCEGPPPESLVAIDVEPFAEGCDNDYPVAVHITNNTGKKIGGVTFTILGRNKGYSTVLANSGPLTSDKIMDDGEVHSLCTVLPMRLPSRPAPADVEWEYSVDVDNVFGEEIANDSFF